MKIIINILIWIAVKLLELAMLVNSDICREKWLKEFNKRFVKVWSPEI